MFRFQQFLRGLRFPVAEYGAARNNSTERTTSQQPFWSATHGIPIVLFEPPAHVPPVNPEYGRLESFRR